MSVYENLASIWRDNPDNADTGQPVGYVEKLLSRDYLASGQQAFLGPQDGDEYLYYMAYLGED